MSKQYGKGSNRRKEDARKVRENWDSIKGFRKMRAQLKERDMKNQMAYRIMTEEPTMITALRNQSLRDMAIGIDAQMCGNTK